MSKQLIVKLEWNEEFETGITEIDEQHLILVNAINDASEKLSEDMSVDLLEQITMDLLSYALYHFETEEEIMKRYGYASKDCDRANKHYMEHRYFSSKAHAIREKLKSGEMISAKDLIGFLQSWLINHILHTDKDLGVFVLSERQKLHIECSS